MLSRRCTCVRYGSFEHGVYGLIPHFLTMRFLWAACGLQSARTLLVHGDGVTLCAIVWKGEGSEGSAFSAQREWVFRYVSCVLAVFLDVFFVSSKFSKSCLLYHLGCGTAYVRSLVRPLWLASLGLFAMLTPRKR